MLKYIPGLVAAVIAYVALKLMNWFSDPGLGTQTVVFFVVYFVVAVVVDKAMSQYGGGSLKSD
jgi:hypothetical protein